MKNSLRNILAISVLLFVACTSDEEERAFQTTVLTIPFAVYDTSVNPLSDTEARSTGDPGVMEKLPAPKYLYIWVTEGDRMLKIYKEDGTEVSHEAINTSSSFWDKKKSEELLPERWEGEHTIDLGKDVVLADGATVQVYAIAAQHQLEEGWLSGIDSPTKLKTLTFSLASWQNSSPVEHSEALGNLYSTPLALMGYGNADAAGVDGTLLHNGSFTVHKSGFQVTLTGTQPVRLYHCAAKADFKWEVVEAQRPGVKIQSITVKGLPTKLKVFEPTHNPAPTSESTTYYDCNLLAASGAVNDLTDGNQWIGREYAYILQPPTTTSTDDGKLTYTVTFTGRPTTPEDKNTLGDQTTSPATNPVFTTWYRVNADIR